MDRKEEKEMEDECDNLDEIRQSLLKLRYHMRKILAYKATEAVQKSAHKLLQAKKEGVNISDELLSIAKKVSNSSVKELFNLEDMRTMRDQVAKIADKLDVP